MLSRTDFDSGDRRVAGGSARERRPGDGQRITSGSGWPNPARHQQGAPDRLPRRLPSSQPRSSRSRSSCVSRWILPSFKHISAFATVLPGPDTAQLHRWTARSLLSAFATTLKGDVEAGGGGRLQGAERSERPLHRGRCGRRGSRCRIDPPAITRRMEGGDRRRQPIRAHQSFRAMQESASSSAARRPGQLSDLRGWRRAGSSCATCFSDRKVLLLYEPFAQRFL